MGINSFLNALDDEAKRSDDFRTNMTEAYDYNPDDEAEKRRLQQQTGIPATLMDEDIKRRAKRQTFMEKLNGLDESHPSTTSFLSDPVNARVAHDDLDNLAHLETLFRKPGEVVNTMGIATPGDQRTAKRAKSIGNAFMEGISSSPENVNQGLARTGQMLADFVDWSLQAFPDETGMRKRVADIAKESADYWKRAADEKAPNKKAGSAESYFQQAGASIGTSLIAAPFGIGGEGAALTMFGLSSEGGYQDMKDAGVSMPVAGLLSTSNSVMEGLTEKIGMDRLYKGNGPVLKKAIEFVLGDLGGEEINTLYNALVDKVTIKPDMTMGDVVQQVVDTAIVTSIAGPAQGVAMHGTAKASQVLYEGYQQKLRADQRRDFFLALGEGAQASKLRERLPEKFREFIAQAKENGGLDNVYIPAENWTKFWQEQGHSPEEMAQEVGTSSQEFMEALASGGDLVIPFEDYATHIAPTEYHQALVKDIRLNPGDMTERELESWIGKMPENLTRVMENSDTRDDSSNQVYDAVLGELLGVGRDRSTAEREALLWQSRYRTRAERLGKDAWSMYQENPLRISRPMPEFMTRRDFVDTSIDTFLDRIRAGDIPSDSEAFGTSLVEFLREKGLRDEGGDLAAMGANEGAKPFQKKLAREDGLPLDKAREAAVEAGYLPEGADISALLNEIDKELRGNPVYSVQHQTGGAADLRGNLENLQRFLDSRGIDVAAMSNEEVRQALKGMDGNNPSMYQAAQVGTENFKRWSNDAPVVKWDEADSYDFKTGEKIVVEVFHGTARPDRVGTRFMKSRATSGPMSFFTANPELASKYAEGKEDTSLANEDMQYSQWFKYQPKGQRSAVDIVRAWYSLPEETKQTIMERMGDIRQDDEGNVIYEEGGGDPGSYQWELQQTQKGWDRRGNPLKAATETWLNSGNLFDDEEKFLTVLELAGFPGKDLKYDPPHAKYPFVYKVYVAMQKPLVTSDIPAEVTESLVQAAKKDRSRAKYQHGADMWDKNTRTLREWVAEFNKEDNDYVWTSIPDKVTEVLKSLGYDGIVDMGGKGGGEKHRVYIPFEETQVKSAIGNRGTYDPFKSNILFQSPHSRQGSETLSVRKTQAEGMLLTAVLKNGEVKVAGVGATHYDVHSTLKAEIPEGLTDANGFVTPDNKFLDRKQALAWVKETRPDVYKMLDKETKANGLESQAYAHAEGMGGDTASVADDFIKRQFGGGLMFFGQKYAEGKRGSITFAPGFRDIALLEKADLSTFLHESGHAWLEEFRQDAQLPDAPEQLRQDWEMLAAWGGFAPDVSSIPVEAHEKFARAVEAYLMEGNAPSVELQPAFQRFKAWLIRIYRSIKGLNVELTDEVRGVMDRLLATDEEITRAKDLQSFHPLFTDAASAGMTEREFTAYRKEVEKAHNEAETRLQQKLMRELTREQKAWWKEERAKVRAEVEKEAQDVPVYQAMQVLTNGKDFEGNAAPEGFKLSKNDLVRMYGKEFVKRLPRSFQFLYSKEGGLHPDEVAEVFGFSSGDEMVRTMANTPTLKKYVEAETDIRMRSVYGDMLNDGTIADEALKALHSDYQGQVLRAELRALRRKQREVSPYVKAEKAKGEDALAREKRERDYERRWMEAEKKLALEMERGAKEEELRKIREEIRANKEAQRKERQVMEAGIPPLDAFKLWAVQAIGNKELRDIRPVVYARAEQKAGKAAFDAAAKGKYDLAGEEKQKQLLNHYLYLEAVKAKEDEEKIVEYARRLEKPAAQSRIGKAGGDYLDQINAILERYEFKKQSLETLGKRQDLREWARQQEELGLEPSIPEELLIDAGKRNYKELTIDELRAVRDALKNIEHLSKEANRIRIEGEEMDLEQAIGELSTFVTENFDAKRIPIDKETRSWLEKQGETLSRFDASLIKAEQLIEWMDGGKINGPWARMIFRPIAAAEAREYDLTLQYTKKLADLFEAYGKEKQSVMMEKVFIKGIGESITKQAAIAAALNTGNESNRTKLLEGYAWSDENLDEILSHLNAQDWDFVQQVWDMIDELWPEIADLEKRLTGVAPLKVEAREFTNAHGTFRGGYFPVVYDPLHSAAGEKQTDAKGDRLFESTYVRATTQKGHTKARIEAAAYPIHLSLEVIPQHMAQVIHDLTHREAVVTANRLLTNQDLRPILNSTIGAPYYKMLKQWLATVANDRNIDKTGNEFWTRFMGTLRTNATIVGMGFRATTMFAQIAGLSQSLDMVKGKYLGTALVRFMQHPFEAMAWVADKSGEMRHRRNSLDRDIRDGVRKLMGKHGAKQWVQAKAFMGVALFDAMVSVPTWMGAYEQAKADNLSEGDAIAAADRAVRLSQGSGGAKDLAAVQRSNDMMKLFTMFYSYFSVLYNRLRNMGRLKGTGEIGWSDVAWKSFVMVMVPAIMGELLAGRGPGDDDDKGEWALRKILVYPFLTIPFLRDIMNSFDSGRPYTLTPMSRLFEMTAKLPKQIESVANNHKELSDLLLQNMDIVGYSAGLPTGQVRTTTKYLWDLTDGDVQPEDMGDVLKGLVFGHKKEGKK